MSRIQARPFISDVIESLTTQQKTTLGGLVDGSTAVPTFRSLINPAAYITSADQGVSHIILETQDKRITGYLIYNATYCVLIGYAKDTQDLSIYRIDLTTQTASRVNEPLTILELRFTIAGSSTFDPSGLEAQIALKEDSANKSSSIGATPSEVKFPTEKAVADYVQAKALAGLPTITIAVSQVISQDPLQVQLTDEQYATMNGHPVILDLSALNMPVVVADYDGQYTDDDGVTYLDFVFNYGGGHSLYLNRILVNPSTKVATYRGESTYPVYARRAYQADLVIYRSDTPTSANTRSGALQIVVLSSEPATRYNGYLYIITGSN